MGLGNRELVGIDFSNNNLKVAYVKVSASKREVVSLLNRNISGLDDADISKVIRTCFDELKVKNPAIINNTPTHLAITKNIEIPSLDHREIKEIINLQADRHTPYSREEIITDYIDVGTYKQSYTKILLIIVARNIIKRQFEILAQAGLRLEKVLFAPEGMAWFTARLLKIETESSPISVVHIDEGFTDFTILFKNKPIFIRSIPIGAQHLIGERDKYGIKFTEELKRSLEAYQNESIEKSPNMLVLTGAIEELKYLVAILKGALNLPVKTTPYLNLLISQEALKNAQAAKGVSFLNVLTPLICREEAKINLIPEEIRLKRLLEERGKDLINTGILVLSIFILTFSILMAKVYFKAAYLKKLNTKYQTLEQEAQKFEKDFSRISLLRNYLSKRGYSLAVLTELHNIIPLDLGLNDIKFDEQDKFSIRGTAMAMSTVFSLVDNMEKSKYFRDVKTKYTSRRKDGLRDVTDFEITCFLKRE